MRLTARNFTVILVLNAALWVLVFRALWALRALAEGCQ